MSNETTPAPATAGAKAPETKASAAPSTSAEKLLDGVRSNPKPWIIGLAVLAVALSGWLIWKDQSRKQEVEFRQSYFTERREIFAGGNSERVVERSRALLQKFQGTELNLTAHWDHAELVRVRSTSERDPAVRLEHLREANRMYSALDGIVASTPLAKLPATGSTDFASALQQRKDWVTKELAWMEAQAAGAKLDEATDADLKATLVLENAEGKTFNLEVRFFSARAPVAVAHFLATVQEGHWVGTHVTGLAGRDQGETFTTLGVHLGSYFSKVAPDRKDIWGSEQDFVGFTLPVEDSGIAAKRGRIGFKPRRESQAFVGNDPMSLVILTTDESPDPSLQVFAEITGLEGDQDALNAVLDELPPTPKVEGAPAEDANFRRTTKTLKVKEWTVTGTPAVSPKRAFLREFVLPEVPAAPAPTPPSEGTPPSDTATPPGGDANPPR